MKGKDSFVSEGEITSNRRINLGKIIQISEKKNSEDFDQVKSIHFGKCCKLFY